MEYQTAKEKFIQAWGTLGTNWGINRTMAQIHALLLISTEHLSAEDVMEDLKISRGNANMNLRALIDWGLVYKEFVPGERKEFFTAEKDIWVIAKKIARQRKEKELDPMVEFISRLESVEGNSKEVKEFKKVTSDIKNFSNQAEMLLDMFVESKTNWLLKMIASVKK